MTDVMIRPAIEEDAAVIAAIHAESWRDAYAHILAPEFLQGNLETDKLAMWSQRLGDPEAGQMVNLACDPAGTVQGFICTYCDFDPVWGSMIDNLHIRPQTRGHGIGERLLRDMAHQLSQRASVDGMHLWVFEANLAGIRFYERLGGQAVEKEVSDIPAAGGKLLLRMHWPILAKLSNEALLHTRILSPRCRT